MDLGCLSHSIFVFCCFLLLLLKSSVIPSHLSGLCPLSCSHFLLRLVWCVFVSFLCILFFFIIDVCIYFFIYLFCPPESPAGSVGTEWLPAESPCAAGDQSSLYFPPHKAPGAAAGGRDTCSCFLPPVVRALAPAQALPQSYKRLSVPMCFGI